MKGIPIYIKHLEIKGVKTLDSLIKLDLTKKGGSLSQWTVILGDNGIGKTTLLHCIAWMSPSFPEGDEPTPIINDEENEALEKLVSRHNPAHDSARIKATFVANHKLNQPKLNEAKELCELGMEIALNEKQKLQKVEPLFKSKSKEVFAKNGVVIFGYGASRQLGQLNLNDPKLSDTLSSFLKEHTVLYDAEEILHALNYSALGTKQKGLERNAKKYDNFIRRVKEMLVTILPDFEEIKDLDIIPPNVLGVNKEGGVLITTKHGEKIPFSEFSLGYKTVVSWTVDLAWRMFNKYHEVSQNPLEEPAIVLVDEIDLHLHPMWQREIMFNLSKHFPNVQFIATAHSPLMVQAAIQSNYAVLKFVDGHVELLNEPTGVDGWRVDQILTSELFGLKSSRGLKYEELLEKREKILAKKRMTKEDKNELKRIEGSLKELPTGENPEEIENRKMVSDIIGKIKSGAISIKL